MSKGVFITGATNGTGYAIAERFAKEGYNVFIGSRSLENAEAAAKKIAENYKVFALGIETVIMDENNVRAIFSKIKSRGYTVNTLVLNAANLGIGQSTLEVPISQFMDVISTNIGWNFMMAREAALGMMEIGGGSIVFVTSNTAYRAIPNRAAYSASKSGILGLARALALDLGKYNIKINSVLPGMIKTDRWRSNLNGCQNAPSNHTPLHDIAEYDDVANAVYFLGSEQSRNTTGAELTVDGGNMIQLYPIIDNG